jgi:hypothetical protein
MCVARVVVACNCSGYRQCGISVPGNWVTDIAGPISGSNVERLDIQVQHRLLVDISDEYDSQSLKRSFELTHTSVTSGGR